jgi:hypothetical protein
VGTVLRGLQVVYGIDKPKQSPSEDHSVLNFGGRGSTKAANHHRSETEPVTVRSPPNLLAAPLARRTFVLTGCSVQWTNTPTLQHVGGRCEHI